MWDLPGPGLEPVSPALAGGFLTTAPPGKPLKSNFFISLPRGKEDSDPEFVVYQFYAFTLYVLVTVLFIYIYI